MNSNQEFKLPSKAGSWTILPEPKKESPTPHGYKERQRLRELKARLWPVLHDLDEKNREPSRRRQGAIRSHKSFSKTEDDWEDQSTGEDESGDYIYDPLTRRLVYAKTVPRPPKYLHVKDVILMILLLGISIMSAMKMWKAGFGAGIDSRIMDVGQWFYLSSLFGLCSTTFLYQLCATFSSLEYIKAEPHLKRCANYLQQQQTEQ